MTPDLRNSRKRILIRPPRIDGLLSSSGNAVVIAIAFIRTVGSVIRPFQLGEMNVLTWNVLNGRIRRFAECQGVAGIGNHTARNGYNNTSGIALDGNRMIWTWKFDLLCFHVLGFCFLYAKRMPAASTNSVGAVWCCELIALPRLIQTHWEPFRDRQAQRHPAQIFQTKSVCCSPTNAAPAERRLLR